MDETFPLDVGGREAEMTAAIDGWISEMKALREEMRRQDVAIEEDSRQTRIVLDEIATALADLKAA